MKRIKYSESSIHGQGIFADEEILKGEKIQYLNGKKMHRVTKSPLDSEEISHWIGTGKSTWINTEGTPFRYINHSCNPNAAITGTKTLVALENIHKEDEITIDYSMTDADPYWSIECTCGAQNCRKVIRAVYSVPPEVFLRHMPYVPRYFQRAYIRSHIQTKLNSLKSKS
jgi:uncharacterized protein